MDVNNVSEQDARMAAYLMQLLAVSERLLDSLKLAGLPVNGPGLDRRTEACKWFVDLSKQMASSIQSQKKSQPEVKVKAMGSTPGLTKKSRRNK